MTDEARLLLSSFIVPALGGAFASALARTPGPLRRHPAWALLAGQAVLLLVVAGSGAMVLGQSVLQQGQSSNRLLLGWLAGGAALAAAAAISMPQATVALGRRVLAGALAALALGGALAYVAGSAPMRGVISTQPWALLWVFGAVAVAVSFALRYQMVQPANPFVGKIAKLVAAHSPAALLAVLGAATSATLALGGSLSLSQLAGLGTSVAGGAWAAGAFNGVFSVANAAARLTYFGAALALWCAHLFGELTISISWPLLLGFGALAFAYPTASAPPRRFILQALLVAAVIVACAAIPSVRLAMAAPPASAATIWQGSSTSSEAGW